MGKTENGYRKQMIAWYAFGDKEDAGKDSSGKGHPAKPEGKKKPQVTKIDGRPAASFAGGEYGASYFQLPEDLLLEVSDENGLTVSAWLYFEKGVNVWERVFDFGKGQEGPYVFLTRNLRGDCFYDGDLLADAGKLYPSQEWIHVAMSVTGTKGGTMSNAGPRVYVNGELAADGLISQTSSGAYKHLRAWFETLQNPENYSRNYIGHSQYEADADFCGAMSDIRIYKTALTSEEVVEVMCETMTEHQIVELAAEKFLPDLPKIITSTQRLQLPSHLLEGKVLVTWISDHPEALSHDGTPEEVKKPEGVVLYADVGLSDTIRKSYALSVLPKEVPPYELTIHGEDEVLDISKTLYGLFYEDINNAADGGLYAELVANRSFESFEYEVYDFRSGENGTSAGRRHKPLEHWYGELEKVTVKNKGGLREHFRQKDSDINAYYITVQPMTKLINRGFTDLNGGHAMYFKKDVKYEFSIWAKPEGKQEQAALIKVELEDRTGAAVSLEAEISVEKKGGWKKYTGTILTAMDTCYGQLAILITGAVSVDMISLMPSDVWGSTKEKGSATAHRNYLGNPNYRLRKDLVEAMRELHPKFLRFPGGCISEGSYLWENVYDWKDSVGEVEVRKENYNVWGYMMTLGLGYMEYFQLAEDLNAEPLPVMACGVLCQARSDYANPAGGRLQKKYIKNFTDLIDFAISTDTENNPWAALRKKMGHEEPFGLHYLGVGNENWGEEFFASFEAFRYAIHQHMKKNYPEYPLTILSTAGAQADDDAYQEGWKYLSGHRPGQAAIRFTDGTKSWEEEVKWYRHQKNFMETIVDEHYYRANDYLLENADRYNYYYRAYKKDGSLNENQTSKVFVGEYASNDKNTLAGAVAEAAVMTGFERNSDVVRLAAYAPLFNKVLTDGTYRWTPDAIWFDDETVWRTPNYYVQQMFAKYLGTKLLSTTFETYVNGEKQVLKPHGGIVLAAGSAELLLKQVQVISNEKKKQIIFEQDFTEPLKEEWKEIPGSAGYVAVKGQGILLKAQESGRNGIYIDAPEWENYTVIVKAEKRSSTDGFYVGVGLAEIEQAKRELIEYAVGYEGKATGVKVFKAGKEAYTMGDYSSSSCVGNLRAVCTEEIEIGREYTLTVNYGGKDGTKLCCSYSSDNRKGNVLEYKLEAYNRDIYHSVTKDEQFIYLKMVNADLVEKAVRVGIEDIQVKGSATLITLTGPSELVSTPNVNQKNDEKVVPVLRKEKLKKGAAVFQLPANSVTVAVFERK